MEPKKLTRQEIIEKYGYDPKTRTSTKAPTTGAISGSEVPTASGTPTQKKPIEQALAEIRGVQSGQRKPIDQALAEIRSGGVTDSGFKPGKLVQAMEDYRPDYIEKGQGSGENGKRTFGDIYDNVSEGLKDVGVGAVKGAIRMPVNIAQALTLDAMWGENSLLNSDSQRAQTFASATKGKTGLQKLGATGFDVVSTFTPAGLAKGGLTLAGLAGKGAGKAAALATGKNTGLLAMGLNKIAPVVGESIASTAMLGGDAQDVGLDVGIGIVSPFAGKVLNKLKDFNLSPSARASIAEVVGSSKMADEALEQAVKIVKEGGPEVEKRITNGRKIMQGIFKPSQIGELFGGKDKLVNEDAMIRFNEVSDAIMELYKPTVGVNKKLDWTDAVNKLNVDEIKTKQALDMSEQLIGKLPVNTNDVFIAGKKNLGGKFNQQYKPIINEAVSDVQEIFNKYLQTSGLGTKSARSQGILPLQNIDAVRQGINTLISETKDQIKKKVYMAMKSSIDTVGANVSNKAGFGDEFQQYLADKNNYLFLQDTKSVLKKLRDVQNPFTTSQLTDHMFGLAAGGTLSTGGGLPYYGFRILSKLMGNTYGSYKVKSLSADPIRNAMGIKRASEIQQGRSKLAEAIEKQKASKAKK